MFLLQCGIDFFFFFHFNFFNANNVPPPASTQSVIRFTVLCEGLHCLGFLVNTGLVNHPAVAAKPPG